MIVDMIENADLYRGLPRRLVTALEFLKKTDLKSLPVGRQELEGSKLYVLVQEYPSKPMDKCVWEAHKLYHDVQYVVSGVERMGYGTIKHMNLVKPYDSAKDAAFYSGDGNFVTMQPGMFMILAPQDVHMPGLMAGASVPMRKIVIKVAVGD